MALNFGGSEVCSGYDKSGMNPNKGACGFGQLNDGTPKAGANNFYTAGRHVHL